LDTLENALAVRTAYSDTDSANRLALVRHANDEITAQLDAVIDASGERTSRQRAGRDQQRK
jgi:hypothetical protein